MAEHVVLIGMMGAGKTTVGRIVAARLGLPHFDSDAQVEARTGATVAELFARHGEAEFRRQESAVLVEALSGPPAVISAAGGTVLAEENRQALSNARLVVWLRATLTTLVARVGSGEGRPLLGEGPEPTLRRLLTERERFYLECADLVVDVDDLSGEQVAEQITLALQGAEGSP